MHYCLIRNYSIIFKVIIAKINKFTMLICNSMIIKKYFTLLVLKLFI